ncbi:GNAT family N-acetyltransferase [Cytobacillus firmus]|uniref:GNAT family N-acetyltransferase n=1 Tax=Cytobacillus firmus TaxID=1399 RepID=UPI0018CE81D0|nr:GNAT family N-acetyltransferase [Cytobacillus firmus]MBG9446181.1 GNAT family acetyltransferase [Cytobacillus firmus]URT71616.1 GNAT family N-acetyltransferase [Cytobacillus firmus]
MKIRAAELSDAGGIAKVHVDSWRTTYKNIIPEEFLENLSYQSREELWINIIPKGIVFVAENDEGQIVGFSSGGKERSGDYKEYQGELSSIYILKEFQGQGIGKALVKSVTKELGKSGMNTMLVFVLADNNSTLFYEAMGGKVIDKIEVEIAGKKLYELVYGWDTIDTLSGQE